MSSPHDMPEPRELDAYLDGTLDGPARENLAREIARNRELRGDVELQVRIDATIRRTFLAPEMSATLLAALEQAAVSQPASSTPNGRPRLGRGSVSLWSAILMTGLIWGYVGWQFLPARPRPRAQEHPNDLASIYQRQLTGDGHARCTAIEEGQFSSTFESRHGQRLRLRPLPQGTQIVGTLSCGGFSPSTTALLARVDGTQVLVFVDRRDDESPPDLPAACTGLKLYRKELGTLVAYELSPFDTPRVIDHFAFDPGSSAN